MAHTAIAEAPKIARGALDARRRRRARGARRRACDLLPPDFGTSIFLVWRARATLLGHQHFMISATCAIHYLSMDIGSYATALSVLARMVSTICDGREARREARPGIGARRRLRPAMIHRRLELGGRQQVSSRVVCTWSSTAARCTPKVQAEALVAHVPRPGSARPYARGIRKATAFRARL